MKNPELAALFEKHPELDIYVAGSIEGAPVYRLCCDLTLTYAHSEWTVEHGNLTVYAASIGLQESQDPKALLLVLFCSEHERIASYKIK